MLDCFRVVPDGGGGADNFARPGREREDRLAADALDLAVRHPAILVGLDSVMVKFGELKLERRRPSVEDENLHRYP